MSEWQSKLYFYSPVYFNTSVISSFAIIGISFTCATKFVSMKFVTCPDEIMS